MTANRIGLDEVRFALPEGSVNDPAWRQRVKEMFGVEDMPSLPAPAWNAYMHMVRLEVAAGGAVPMYDGPPDPDGFDIEDYDDDGNYIGEGEDPLIRILGPDHPLISR